MVVGVLCLWTLVFLGFVFGSQFGFKFRALLFLLGRDSRLGDSVGLS